MRSTELQKIEEQIDLLSDCEKIILIESLARSIRQKADQANFSQAMAAMAVDPDLQRQPDNP
jgi:hypothetical protein